MADIADIADERQTPITDARIADMREAAASMPVGEPGICDLCGEWSGRLVNGACAPCRDRYKLP